MEVPYASKTPLQTSNNAEGEIPFTSKIPPPTSNNARRQGGGKVPSASKTPLQPQMVGGEVSLDTHKALRQTVKQTGV